MASFHFTFTLRRRDYIASVALLTRWSIRRRLLLTAAWFGGVLGVLLLARGAEGTSHAALRLLRGELPWTAYAAQVGVLAIIWFRAEFVALWAALSCREQAMARREASLAIDETGITCGLRSRTPWSQIAGIRESASHLVFVTAPSQGIVLARRAVASEQEYAALRALIARRFPGGSREAAARAADPGTILRSYVPPR